MKVAMKHWSTPPFRPIRLQPLQSGRQQHCFTLKVMRTQGCDSNKSWLSLDGPTLHGRRLKLLQIVDSIRVPNWTFKLNNSLQCCVQGFSFNFKFCLYIYSNSVLSLLLRSYNATIYWCRVRVRVGWVHALGSGSSFNSRVLRFRCVDIVTRNLMFVNFKYQWKQRLIDTIWYPQLVPTFYLVSSWWCGYL